jgi:pSer/pThr/pTyr-binding forkhead associated (FHA) protein
MHARLVCQSPQGIAKEISLSHLPVLVGRGEEVDVQVPDLWVSRQHCQIDQRHGVLVVKDLGSRHGTWLNDQRVEEAEIHPGDRLAIGMTTLTATPSEQREKRGTAFFASLPRITLALQRASAWLRRHW